MRNIKEIKAKLVHAVTDYDRKQSTKRGYNHYALGIYFQRIDEIVADIERGADVRAAIVAGFSDRLVDKCLAAVCEPITTNEEAQKGAIIYTPAFPLGRW